MSFCGLYIHIPFCKRKCLYCDFPSYSNMEKHISPYIEALKREIKLIALKHPGMHLTSIFIGGGTPTYISYQYMQDILQTVQACFDIQKEAEVSIEANPGTFDFFRLQKYREMGINRLSIGLQAWQDRLLKKLGRIHTQKEFLKGFQAAKEAGFQNINIDLMLGLPDQSLEDWKETLRQVSSLNPTHLSCYSLIVEEGTPFYTIQEQGKLKLDEDLEREMYYYTQKYLKKQGYDHYEISNFAKQGFECRHNLLYWNVKPYIGVGVAAHSFINDVRYANISLLPKYIEELSHNRLPIVREHTVTKQELIQEFMFLGLRKIEGVSKQNFHQKFGKSIEKVYRDVLQELQDKKLLQIKGDNIFLTSKGLDFANRVFQAFL